MNILEFHKKYDGQSTTSIDRLLEIWTAEEKVDSVLKTVLSNGETVLQVLLHPEARHDGISQDLLDGFKHLMKEKANTAEKVRSILMERAHRSPHALQGMLSKIQGQIGEDHFVKFVGSAAELPTSGSQEGWDVLIHGKHGDKFVQVKIYDDPAKVIAEMKKVSAKLAAGKIHHGARVVKKIHFAVNDDIYDEVKRRVQDGHLKIGVLKAHTTRMHARSGFSTVSKRMAQAPVENLLHDLLKGVVVGAAIVGATNAFLVWKGAKDARSGFEDTIYGSASAAGATASVVALKLFVGALGGPIGFAASTGVAFGSRAVLDRFFDRRFVVPRLEAENEALRIMTKKFA